jgi:hypothetical protein
MDQTHGNRLDPGTASGAGRRDSALSAVGEIDRAEVLAGVTGIEPMARPAQCLLMNGFRTRAPSPRRRSHCE